MAQRSKIGSFYVERRADGTFKNWVAIRRSLRKDRLKRALKRTKSGYGHRGDR